MAKKNESARPASDAIQQELDRVENRRRFSRVLRNTMAVFVSVAAIAVLLATFLLPVMRIYGNAMTPTIAEGELVLAIKTKAPERGDILGFYYNNRILIRRVIALPGETVSIDEFGNVTVNSLPLAEAYIYQKTLGECDLEFPYIVPDDSWFVMGDNRLSSVDSRSSVVGCVTQDQLVGKVFACLWPLKSVRFFDADFRFS
jgi:signal peptidase I